MTLLPLRFTNAVSVLVFGLCLSFVGCSDSEETADSDSGGDTAAAVTNAAAPGLAGIQNAAMAGGEDYGNGMEENYDNGSGEGDYGGGPTGNTGAPGAGYNGGMPAPGRGGMAAMNTGSMDAMGMGETAGMNAGGPGGPGAGYNGGMDPAGMNGGGMGEYDGGEMEDEYGGGGGGNSGYGLGQNFGGPRFGGNSSGNRSSLPSDYNQWSDDDYVAAAKEKNEVLVAAIQAKAGQAVGDPAFADLMGRVLNESAGVSAPAAGMFGFGGSAGNGPDPAGSASGMATPYRPKTKVPPGGAFMFPTAKDRFQKDRSDGSLKVSESAVGQPESLGFDTIEMIIAESLLGYSPQAASAIGARAQSLAGPGAAEPQGMQVGTPGAVGGRQNGGAPLSPGIQAPSGMEAAFGGGSNRGGVSGGPSNGRGPSSFGGAPRSGGGFQPGGNFQPNGNPNAGSTYSGSLSPEALVKAVVSGLATSNSAKSWKLLQDIYDGTQPTPLPMPDAQGIVLAGILSAREFDAAIVQPVLEQAVFEAISNPESNAKSLQILAMASAQTTGHYFKLTKAEGGGFPGAGPSAGAGRGPSGMSGPPQGGNLGAGFGGPPSMSGPGGGPRGMSGPGAPGGMEGVGGGPRGMSGPGAPGGMEGVGGGPRGMSGPGAPGGMEGPGMGGGGYGGGEDDGEYGEGSYGGGMGAGPNFGGRNTANPPPPQMQISQKMYPVLAEVLWSQKNTSALASAIAAAGDLQGAEPLMPFAVSVPNDAVRKAVFQILQTQYKSGAKGLASVGFFTKMLSDPGMLPILKSLPRQRPPRTSSNNAAAAAPETPESTWTDGTKQAVMALRERMRIAATNPDLAYDGAMPLRLHRNAVAQRAIRFTTKNDDFKALGENGPSETTYYYVSCSIAPTRASELEGILEHYEKRSKGFKRLQNQSLLWFDGMKTSANGMRVSMDVIVEDPAGRSRGGGYGGGPGGEYGGGGGRGSGQYEIEVILVEVRDPKAVVDSE